MTQYITQETFKLMVAEFLHTQDDANKDEWYCTPRDNAEGVLEALREHLFREEIERAARYKQYLELRAEFACHGEPGETE